MQNFYIRLLLSNIIFYQFMNRTNRSSVKPGTNLFFQYCTLKRRGMRSLRNTVQCFFGIVFVLSVCQHTLVFILILVPTLLSLLLLLVNLHLMYGWYPKCFHRKHAGHVPCVCVASNGMWTETTKNNTHAHTQSAPNKRNDRFQWAVIAAPESRAPIMGIYSNGQN